MNFPPKNSKSAVSQHFGTLVELENASEVSFEVNELASAVAAAANATGHPTDSQPARLEVEVAVSNHDKVWYLKGKHWNFWKKVKMSSKSDKTKYLQQSNYFSRMEQIKNYKVILYQA